MTRSVLSTSAASPDDRTPIRACLVVPCYNEVGRLDFARFAELPGGIVCLLVDDGSKDATLELARKHESARLRVLGLPRNVGKAGAVRQGILYAREAGLLDAAEWVGYWDADMATPFSEIEYLLAYAALDGRHVDAIFGSRVYKLGSRIDRSWRRHVLGRLFATVSANLLDLDVYDSQCGAKLFRTGLVRQVFDEPFISRWVFDVEVLLRLRGRDITECPLRQWADTPGGTLRVSSVATSTLIDLWRIRRRYFGFTARTLALARRSSTTDGFTAC